MLRALKPGKLLLAAGIAIILVVGIFLFRQLRNRSAAAATDVTTQDVVANVNDGKTQIVIGDNPVLINSNNGTRKILRSELQVAPAPTAIPTQQPAAPVEEESVQPQTVEPTAEPQPLPATAVPPTADPNNCNTGRSHTVQQGENVFRISRAFNVSQQAIRDINGLGAFYTIYPGQVLCLPGEANGSPSESTLGQPGATVFTNGVCAAGWHEHTVFNGSTLFGLALEHGTTVDNLRSVNGLSNDIIYPGQLLCMPN